ncbi:hypothetical protein CYMTET_17471 [Cymbomonas tetramitiformis]|uniref:Uncharacterized protein n=1 Tax=Cymbomonas tetramitiformis TaxID=36881 RepID=A0AAE0L7A4_9CHLO|nr:hypothetical protein CYMTET_17471 [Cymbomonas tetramitiformis]
MQQVTGLDVGLLAADKLLATMLVLLRVTRKTGKQRVGCSMRHTWRGISFPSTSTVSVEYATDLRSTRTTWRPVQANQLLDVVQEAFLAPAISHLHDAAAHSTSTLKWLMDTSEAPDLESLAYFYSWLGGVDWVNVYGRARSVRGLRQGLTD